MPIVLRSNGRPDLRLDDEHARALAGALWDAQLVRGSAVVAAAITHELRRTNPSRHHVDLGTPETTAVDDALNRLGAAWLSGVKSSPPTSHTNPP